MPAQTEGLTDLQRELLKLYANPVSDEVLLEIRTLLAQFFAQKATEAMETCMEEKGLTADDLVQWTHAHERAEGSHWSCCTLTINELCIF